MNEIILKRLLEDGSDDYVTIQKLSYTRPQMKWNVVIP